MSYSYEENEQMDNFIQQLCEENNLEPEELKPVMLGLIREAVERGEKGKTLDNEKFLELVDVRSELELLFGEGCVRRQKLYPAFDTGDIGLVIDGIQFDREKIEHLQGILSKCFTADLEPRLDGKLNFGVSMTGLYKDAEEK